MAKLGLSKQELDKVLENAGIGGDNIVSAENIRAAIATAIAKNNEALEKQITEFVSGKLLQGKRF